MDLASAFSLTVARRPDAIAVVDGDRRLSFRECHAESARLAGGLARLGLRAGDHLLLLLKNRYQNAALYWACHSAESVREALAQSGLEALPRVVLADVRTEPGDASYADLAAGPALERPIAAEEDSTCLMLYTSGTTGKPKGVPRSHRNELAATVSMIAHNRYVFGDSALGVMPMYHTMGVRVLLAAALLNGKFVCVPAYDTELALRLIQDEGITTMFLVPTLYYDMVNHPDFSAFDLRSLKRIGYAGMTMTNALSAACMDQLKPELFVNYYGTTEVYTLSFCDHVDAKPGCAGRPGLNQMLRLVVPDPEGKSGPDDLVAPGEPGEIIASLASPEAFAGYWRRPDANAKALRSGWYFTGDLGRRDEDGELYVIGRLDDMVITGGENVYPEEVENALSHCPLVRRAAVIGIPDERWGQKLVAFVEPAAGASAEGLAAYMREAALANYKRPKEYVLIERIPQSPVGKILRRELRAGNYRRVQ
ncbi:MAG: AMP-binding protein [Betaproteobacteria bacterium]|nr:AMP-binding protein [Betaproteobacteria bacterium]